MGKKTAKKSVTEFNTVEMAYHIIGLLDCTPKSSIFDRVIKDLRKWRPAIYRPK